MVTDAANAFSANASDNWHDNYREGCNYRLREYVKKNEIEKWRKTTGLRVMFGSV
jgi:hypothetical protein